ncbi:MAG: nitrous oxide reductase accessory protein NosL [Thermodesulfovibrionales bacterium]
MTKPKALTASSFVYALDKRSPVKRFVIYMVLCLLLSFTVAGAADTMENPKHCKQCGMDLDVYAKSRMVIGYADGTTVAVCSLHCAAAEMKQNKDRQVRSLMVADYSSKELTDAKTARWVVGGVKEGVMTSVPKWAFVKEEDAQKFAKETGGKVSSFDQAMKAAEEEIGEGNGTTGEHHAHAGHDMSQHKGPGAQMLFNPAFGDDIYHTHPAGMWMVNYKFMHMNMSGLRSGTSDVGMDSVGYKRDKPYNYMMIPTGMTMDMHMFMLMYGITDRLTVMAMANYQVNSMGMLMDMGPMMGSGPMSPMRTSGFADTELRGIYKINKYLVGSLGLSLPTGSIDKEFETMQMTFRAPYDMQLGSGTYDLKPALTYSALSDDAKWNWGGQAMYTYHIDKNKNDYSLGDNLKITGWLQRAVGPVTSWVRLAFNDTGRIKGQDPEIQKLLDPMMGAPTPDADPNNYGGQRLDGLIGVSYQKGSLSFGVEGGVPLYQYLNGLQMKTTWVLNAGVQLMF